MAFLNYEYKMKIKYSKPVDKCYFTIKTILENVTVLSSENLIKAIRETLEQKL